MENLYYDKRKVKSNEENELIIEKLTQVRKIYSKR